MRLIFDPILRKLRQRDTEPSSAGGLTSIPVGQSLFVSMTGDDGTALPYRFDKMYSTVNAAYTAAAAGDTIFVYPGSYNTSITLKDNVTVYLLPGAFIYSGGNVISDGGSAVGSYFIGWGGNTGISGTINQTTTSNIVFDGIDIFPQAGPILVGGTMLLKNLKVASNGSGQPAISLLSNNLTLDNVRIIADAVSINAAAPQNIRYLSAFANVAVSGVITNLIIGTTLIVDSDVS